MPNRKARRAKIEMTSKRDLVQLCQELREIGIGVTNIAALLGYDRSYIIRLMNDFGLRDGKRRPIEAVLLNLLPMEMRARCMEVQVKSRSFRSRVVNRDGLQGMLVEEDEPV